MQANGKQGWGDLEKGVETQEIIKPTNKIK